MIDDAIQRIRDERLPVTIVDRRTVGAVTYVSTLGGRLVDAAIERHTDRRFDWDEAWRYTLVWNLTIAALLERAVARAQIL